MMTGQNVAMSNHEERLDGSADGPREDFATASNMVVNGSLGLDNSLANLIHAGVHAEVFCDDTIDQLAQNIMELSLQNDYFKGQLKGMKHMIFRSVDVSESESQNKDGKSSGTIRDLQEMIRSLNKEIQEHRETQKAAEDALGHLRAENSEADGKVQDLSLKLIEAQQRMEREIKERDDKYVELDSKFGRLHKRAKQRIQELQKENDDLEARLHDSSIKTEQLSSQLLAAQQEVEQTRHEANEALRSMDAEKQQLRATNNKLRDNVDELLLSLEGKERALEGLQQSLLEKEKALGEVQRSLQILEEKHQVSITDISIKHEKQVESLEAQLADALNERSKATETISSFQMLLAEKDSKIAEIEASSSGEAARLGAALEETKVELIHLKDKYEKERLELEAGVHSLRVKLEASESNHLRSQIEAAKSRSQLEFELSMQKQLLNARDAELGTAKDEINRLEKEFSAYKVRAHALLQKKDNELLAAKNSDVLKEQAETIKETKRELASALQKRDDAIKELEDGLNCHNKEIAIRDAALKNAESQIRTITSKLNSAAAHYQEEKEAWQKQLASVEESWRIRYNELELEKSVHFGNDVLKDLESIRLQYDKLKVEHETLRDIAERTIEKKDEEIGKLVEDNNVLRHSLESSRVVDPSSSPNSDSLKQEAHISSIAVAEQQILLLARQQAQREEELAHSQRHILALQEEIEELERENRLHNQQEAMLKEELRNMERSKKREGVDMTYLKNVILKLLETGEVEALLPVVGMLLQFSPEEIRKCQQAYRPNDASSQATSVDSAPRSLFSRLTLS